MNPADEKYMARCIQLARNGLGSVSPNPMVGAVLVYDGKIIGEGYHRKYGEAHAEVNAISSVKDEGILSKATLYVNLEPCSHYGKTPPCSKLIIAKNIARVVIGTLDPFHEVSGRGVSMLRSAGIDVTVGVLEKESLTLNERFFFFHKHKSPYILLKWAQSADGFIDSARLAPDIPPVIISSPATRRMVHKLRSEVDAIMVGRNTALMDNPSLTVRFWTGRNPVRILVDRHLQIRRDTLLYDGSAPTLIFTSVEPDPHPNVEFIPLDASEDILLQVRRVLYERNIHTLMVEGGAIVLNAFLKQGVNEARMEISDKWIEKGVKAPFVNYKEMNAVKMADSMIHYFKFDRE